jgi:uncharacterized protein (TIGR03067 family)
MRNNFGRGPTAIILFFSCGSLVFAQEPPAAAAQREAMKKLAFLVGRWQGDSWTEPAPGRRFAATGTESVENKLNGLVLVIEGVHRRKAEDGTVGPVVHNALGVISYDDAAKKYRFHGYTDRGNFADADVIVGDGRLTWSIRASQTVEIRYTITLTPNGGWSEIGETSSDGKVWRKFFEMNLKRTSFENKAGAQIDLDRLHGTWSTVSLVNDGKTLVGEKYPPSGGPTTTLSYDGNKWAVIVGDRTVANGIIALDPSKNPQEIDIMDESGTRNERTKLGIYEITGDTYRYCLAPAGKPRPKEFVSKAGTGDSLGVMKRDKQ